ncbi:hypothetical protein BDQ17DRAFT_1353610 [Cyathus striatus]|nr:hypothetical protein BDQ17DRAFT_1353610 [Cyathus striatus]
MESNGATTDESWSSYRVSESVDALLQAVHLPSKEIGSHPGSVRSEITRVESLVAQLQHELARMKALVNRYSPILRFPSEILSEIFKHAIPDVVSENCDTPRELLSPFFLGAVCKEWREIAWATSKVWTNVSILITKATRFSIQVELLDGWLKRSKGLPLAVCLAFDSDAIFGGSTSDIVALRHDPAHIIKLLLDYTKQWRSIDFFLETSWFHHFEYLGGHFPILESVTLRRDTMTREATWTNLDMLVSCPKIRELHIENFSSYELSFWKWSSLQSLEIVYNSVEDTERILSEAKNVRKVSLSQISQGVYRGNPQANQDVGVILPELESFEMIESKARDVRYLMNRLSLPKVQQVRLDTPIPGPDNVISLNDAWFNCIDFDTCFKRWSRACSSTFTSIKIGGVFRETTSILRGFAEFPSLQRVEIMNSAGVPLDALLLSSSLVEGTEVLEYTVSNQKFHPVLPSLREFKYTGPINVLEVQQLVDALYFRWKLSLPPLSESIMSEIPGIGDIKRLEEFTIEAPDSAPVALNGDVLNGLWGLQREGMCININIGGKSWVESEDPILSEEYI